MLYSWWRTLKFKGLMRDGWGIQVEHKVHLFYLFLHPKCSRYLLDHNWTSGEDWSLTYLCMHFEQIAFIPKRKAPQGLSCVAAETKPRYSPSANQWPKACSDPPRVTGKIYNGLWLAFVYCHSSVHRDWSSECCCRMCKNTAGNSSLINHGCYGYFQFFAVKKHSFV